MYNNHLINIKECEFQRENHKGLRLDRNGVDLWPENLLMMFLKINQEVF